jgi:hypothetical protein
LGAAAPAGHTHSYTLQADICLVASPCVELQLPAEDERDLGGLLEVVACNSPYLSKHLQEPKKQLLTTLLDVDKGEKAMYCNLPWVKPGSGALADCNAVVS